MGKVAFIYPGQGSQKAGMGKDFYEQCDMAKKVYDTANQVLDIDVKELCFTENELLDNTAYTQAALVTTCLAMTNVLLEKGIRPDVTAGLSLGEYAAIAAAGGMDMADAIRLVRARGIYMEEAVPGGKGAMAAVLGMEVSKIEEILKAREAVSIANYNCPGQIVITGMKEAVEEAAEALKEAGAKRCVMLNVSGPFHSEFLKEAGQKLGENLKEVKVRELQIPYVTNVTAEFVTEIEETKGLLVKQVSSPVRWIQSVENMIEEAGVETVSAITAKGGSAESMKFNVADYTETSEAITEIIQKHGKLDILVNNAGITKDGLMMRMSEEDFDAVINTNLKGAFTTCKAVSRQMMKQRSGRVINISSVSGVLGNAGQANYASAKAGLIGLTKSMARELASRGVTVNAVAPGFIETDMTKVLSEQVKEAAVKQIPLGSFGKPEDVAELVLFLASDKAKYITGQVICVDGGMAM